MKDQFDTQFKRPLSFKYEYKDELSDEMTQLLSQLDKKRSSLYVR